jgi:hypothetical protein
MRPTGTQKSRTGKRGASRRGDARKGAQVFPANLVTEIVDQITEKQARAASEQPRRSTADTCAFCLEETVEGSPYRVVLQCATGEDPSSGH